MTDHEMRWRLERADARHAAGTDAGTVRGLLLALGVVGLGLLLLLCATGPTPEQRATLADSFGPSTHLRWR